VAGVSTGGAQWFAYASGDARGRFLTSLGMTVPPEVDQASAGSFYVEFSLEQLSLLDQNDVIAWLEIVPGSAEAKIENVAGHENLRVFQEQRLVTLTEEQGAAMGFSSVLSLPALLDELPQQLAAVAGR
jgi:iron complex transport system substrate-binding protein